MLFWLLFTVAVGWANQLVVRAAEEAEVARIVGASLTARDDVVYFEAKLASTPLAGFSVGILANFVAAMDEASYGVG
jgi:hypothetical protein